MCTARLFSQRVGLFALKFYLDRFPINHSWHQETKDTGLPYPMVKTASLCVPLFWHNGGVWRRDKQTDEFAVTYTALALRRAVKITSETWDRQREVFITFYRKHLNHFNPFSARLNAFCISVISGPWSWTRCLRETCPPTANPGDW